MIVDGAGSTGQRKTSHGRGENTGQIGDRHGERLYGSPLPGTGLGLAAGDGSSEHRAERALTSVPAMFHVEHHRTRVMFPTKRRQTETAASTAEPVTG